MELNPKKFLCPKHGEHEHVISSNIKGHEGNWCQICWLESLDRIGIPRVLTAEADKAKVPRPPDDCGDDGDTD